MPDVPSEEPGIVSDGARLASDHGAAVGINGALVGRYIAIRALVNPSCGPSHSAFIELFQGLTMDPELI